MAASVAVHAAIRQGHDACATAIPFAESTIIAGNYPMQSRRSRFKSVHSVAAGTAPSRGRNPFPAGH